MTLKQKLVFWLAFLSVLFAIPQLYAGKGKAFLAWVILAFLWAVVMIFYFSVKEGTAFLPHVVVGMTFAAILAFIVLFFIL